MPLGRNPTVGRSCATEFERFLANRAPLPPHHGLLLDTRAMPFAVTAAGFPLTRHSVERVFGESADGHATWCFELPTGALEIGLTLLGDGPPSLPQPSATSRVVPFTLGPPGLGDFCIEERGGHHHEIGWLRGNVKATVCRSFYPRQQMKLPPERVLAANRCAAPLAEEVAAQLDAWLATLPVVDLDLHRLRLEPVVSPVDPVVKERVLLTWKTPPAEPSRYVVRADPPWQHVACGEVSATRIECVAESAGRAALDVRFIDTVTLVASYFAVPLEVFDFSGQVRGLGPEQLLRLLSRDRPERSFQVLALLLPAANAHGGALAKTYAWWTDDSRRQTLVQALWPATEARHVLLREPAFQAELPRWIDFFAARAQLPPGAPDPDGLERHRQVAREVVAELLSLNEAALVTRLALELRPAIVGGTWKSFAEAFHATKNHGGALAALGRISAGVNADSPLYVLWQSNIAAEQLAAGAAREAEQRLDEVLSRPWPVDVAALAEPMAELLRRANAGSRPAGESYSLRLFLGLSYFNRACARAHRRDAAGAAEDITRARSFDADSYPASRLDADPDFDAIRGAPEFLRARG
jgi:hypothetical protein